MTDKPKRNDPCPCGSGKKYKKCCGVKKKLSARDANVIPSGGGSLLGRIQSASGIGGGNGEGMKSLKDRVSNPLNQQAKKKEDETQEKD